MRDHDPTKSVTRWPKPREGAVKESNGDLSIEGRTTSYDPREVWELPDRLVEVVTGLTTPIEFVGEFGLLGFDNLHFSEDLGFPPFQFGDPTAEFILAKYPEVKKQMSISPPSYLKPKTGETVRWFETHARTVRAALDLLAALRLKDETRLRALLKKFPDTQYAALDELSSYGRFDWVSEYAELDLPRAAKAALAALINPNLEGIHHGLRYDALGNLRFEFTFQSLIQVIYWHVAMRVNDEKAVAKYCKRCGNLFFHRDSRQTYCPKPLGKNRSVCGNREGVEAHRARLRENNGRSIKTKRRKHARIQKR